MTYGSHNLLDPGPDLATISFFFRCWRLLGNSSHSDLLRCSTVTIGNDFRLGANEAPPAIVSIYLGDPLTETLKQVEEGVYKGRRSKSSHLRVGVETAPNIESDDSDRNRTSPFAFTGNKFEFRACGSSQSCADFNTFLTSPLQNRSTTSRTNEIKTQ